MSGGSGVSLVSTFTLGLGAQIPPGVYTAGNPYEFAFGETGTFCVSQTGGLRTAPSVTAATSLKFQLQIAALVGSASATQVMTSP